MEQLRLSDYDYALPPELIAQFPAARRSDSRLLRVRAGGGLADLHFHQLPAQLRPGDLLVMNDTRVLAARFFARKPSGGRVEILLERVESPRSALVQLRANKPIRAGQELRVDGGATATVDRREGGFYRVRLRPGGADFAALAAAGAVPLPPYIKRAPRTVDAERYQTVYARAPGAVAAPTAGLHFDRGLFAALAARGVEHCFVTLHVGAGTFQPLRFEAVERHRMHAERIIVTAAACRAVNQARGENRRVVAVGTTTVRALETAAARNDGVLRPFDGETRLFIFPGFVFRATDMLLTNFHLPRSSLLLLAAAFAGRERVMAAYAHAVKMRYRFYSYGDAMLLEKNDAV